jgi:hypothetical protein
MSETSILAIVGLGTAVVGLATLVTTNLFAMWNASSASKSAELAASAAATATGQTHLALDRVVTKLDAVHATMATQPDRGDLTAAIAALQFQLAEMAPVPVAVAPAPVPAPVPVPDTITSG